MRARVDSGRCQGHTRCNAICPEVFLLDDLGYARVAGGGAVPDEYTEHVVLAARSCPERAISVEAEDADG